MKILRFVCSIWSWLWHFYRKAENYDVLLIFKFTDYLTDIIHLNINEHLVHSLAVSSHRWTLRSMGQVLTVECAYEDSDLANDRDKETNTKSACVRAKTETAQPVGAARRSGHGP